MHVWELGEGGEGRGIACGREDGEATLLERFSKGGADAAAAACNENALCHFDRREMCDAFLKLPCGIYICVEAKPFILSASVGPYPRLSQKK